MNIEIGSKVGRLTVVGVAAPYVQPSTGWRSRRWTCVCECGNKTIVNDYYLKKDHTRSCGCYRRDKSTEIRLKHGRSRKGMVCKTHQIWKAMHQRCNSPTATHYDRYGGRGIVVCERWDSYDNFLADMGEQPSKGMSIERIDNDGNYEPENCRWATHTEQMRNTRRNRYVEYGGRRMALSEAAELAGISYRTVLSRVNFCGWPVSRALSEKVRRREPSSTSMKATRRGR